MFRNRNVPSTHQYSPSTKSTFDISVSISCCRSVTYAAVALPNRCRLSADQTCTKSSPSARWPPEVVFGNILLRPPPMITYETTGSARSDPTASGPGAYLEVPARIAPYQLPGNVLAQRPVGHAPGPRQHVIVRLPIPVRRVRVRAGRRRVRNPGRGNDTGGLTGPLGPLHDGRDPAVLGHRRRAVRQRNFGRHADRADIVLDAAKVRRRRASRIGHLSVDAVSLFHREREKENEKKNTSVFCPSSIRQPSSRPPFADRTNLSSLAGDSSEMMKIKKKKITKTDNELLGFHNEEGKKCPNRRFNQPKRWRDNRRKKYDTRTDVSATESIEPGNTYETKKCLRIRLSYKRSVGEIFSLHRRRSVDVRARFDGILR